MKEVRKEFSRNLCFPLAHIKPERAKDIVFDLIASSKRWNMWDVEPLKGRDIEDFFRKGKHVNLPPSISMNYKPGTLDKDDVYGYSVCGYNKKTSMRRRDYVEVIVYDTQMICAALSANKTAASEIVIRYLDEQFRDNIISELRRIDQQCASYQPNSL